MGAAQSLALAGVLAGCYQPSAATGVPCAANGDCPGSQLCDQSRTPPVCVTTLPSPDGPRPPDARIDASPDGAQPPDAPPDAPAPMLLVQQTTAKQLVSTSLSATLPSLPANGDVLLVVGTFPAQQIVTVSGGGVASWTQAAGSFVDCNSEIWWGVTDGSSATVTIADAMSTQQAWLNVSEWSGLVTPVPVENGTGTAGTTSPASAGTLLTAHAKDLLLFTVSDHTPNTFGDPTPGTWTLMTPVSVGGCTQSEWYTVVSASGTYAPAATETAHLWDATIAAFQIAP